MGASQRNKGANAERELIRLLAERLDIADLRRNLEQTRNGGFDVLGLPGIALEVKRQETLALPAWWRQTVSQALRDGGIPVLAYRQNRRPWRFCLPATFLVPDSWGFVELDLELFLEWMKRRLSDG